MEIDSFKETSSLFYGTNAVIIRKKVFREPYHECFHYHWHERMELIRIHSGSIKVNFGEEIVTVKEGSLIIISPYRLHGGITEDQSVVFQTVMFELLPFYNNTVSVSDLLHKIEHRKVRFDYSTDNTEIITAIDRLFTYINRHEYFMPLMIASSIYEIIALLYKHCVVSDDIPTVSGGKLSPILKYIDKHFQEKITSASICSHFGYSQGYFCRKFKKVTGFSLSIYIRLLRLETAKDMLIRSDKSIWQIAQECGFTDFSYFCQCFKNTYKLSPTEFVKRKNNT